MRSSLLLGAVLLALPACASVGNLPGVPGGSAGLKPNEVDIVAQAGAPDGLDPIAEAAFWGTRYDLDPSDPDAAIRFSQALRAVQNDAEALRVMSQIAPRAEGDPRVALELGKALIANDRAYEAIRPIETALAGGLAEDWSAHTAHGVALDKTGRHKEARVQYDRALALAPDNARVLNNKGLSYALSGDHRMAETTLRTAAALPGGSSRVRQNLALILGLAGKTGEAELLARSDLPPQIASGNVAYFQSLVGQPAYWGSLTRENAELPDFGDEPSPLPTPLPAPAAAPAPRDDVPTEKIEGRPAPGVLSSAEPAAPASVPSAPDISASAQDCDVAPVEAGSPPR